MKVTFILPLYLINQSYIRLMAITPEASKLGYSDFTSDQRLVVERFLSRSDVLFSSLPIGSGMSLCYWMLPFASD